MADKIQLPNGAFFPVKEGESKEQALAVAKQMYPDAFAAPVVAEPKQDTTGFKAAASAGFTRLGGELELLKGKLGVQPTEEAEAKFKEAEAAAAKRFTPTEQGWTEAPFQKFKETLGGSVPYMAAPAAAGLAALAAPVAAPVAAGLGLVGAGAVSTGQFTGANLARQMETGKTLEEASLGKAVGAAVPQALIDTAAMALLPGVGKLFGSVGAKLTAEQAKAIASQTLARTAADYTAKTGLAMGREGITEVAQQTLERLQAGLEIADPEARKEYIDSFIGGAVLGGAIAPVGRAIERGGAKGQAAAADRTERLATKAEEQRVAAEAAAKEAEFKQSPDYALQVAEEYAAAEKAKADLLAQKRTITKGSPTETADRAFNQTLYAQIAQMAPQLKTLGAEYARLEPQIKEAAEQKRIEGLTPEEFSLEQMQADLASTPEPRTREERLAALNVPIETETEVAPEADYAADRIALAKEQMGIATDVNDYVSYLLTNPRMAQAIVDNQTPITGLKRAEQNAVRSALKLQLQAIERQRAAAGRAGTAATQERIGSVEQEEQVLLEEQRRAEEAEAARLTEQRAETEREIRIAPEVEGIRRLGKAPEGTWNSPRADQLFREMYRKQADEAQVDKLLATLPMSSVTTPGQIYAGMGFETASRRDLLTRMAIAKAHAGVEDVTQLQQELASLDSKPAETTDVGARLPGEGMLPEAEKKTIAAEKLADQQSQTLREFIRFLEDRKQGKPRGTLRLGRKERLEGAGAEFKDAYAKQYVAETNTRLEAFGLPALTETEANIAKGRVMRNLNELEQRWNAASAAPAGRKTFGAPVQAVEVLQEQMRSGMFKTINEAADRFNLSQASAKKGLTRTAEGGARIATPDELKLRAESTVPKDDKRIATETAKRLRDTLDQRTYATPETPAPKDKEGSNRADTALAFGAPETGLRADINSRLTSLDKDTKDFVRLAADTLDQIEDEALITRIKEGLQDVAEGRKVSALTQQELKDFVATRAKDIQSTTRPGATPEELQRTSAQPQMGLPGFDEVGERTQRVTPKNFQKMLDSKDVQGMRAAIEKMRTDNIEALQEAARNTPAALRAARTAKARVDYNAALARAQQTSPVAKAFQNTVIAERDGAQEAVDTLTSQLENLQLRVAEVVSLRDALSKEPTDMSLLIRAPGVLSQEKALNKRLEKVSVALEDAKALVQAIDKQQAATKGDVTKAIEDAKQAEKELVDAQKELTKANQAERDAEVEVKQIKSERDTFREAAQRGREGLDLPGLRSTVDTTKMKQQIARIRSEMGSFNALAEKETDPAKKAEYQRRYDAAEKKLETVYADAPRITTAIKEKDQLAAEKAFDDAQIAAYDKQAAKRRIKGGEYGPALASRRQGAVARAGNTERVVQTGEKRATPATEMAGSALERVAQERAALKELEDRVAFLRTNGKDKVKGRLTDAFKKLQDQVVKQKAVVSETEEAQKAVVAAVRNISAETSARRTSGKALSVGAQERLLGEVAEAEKDGGAVFRTTTRGGPTLSTKAVSNLVDRITANWKNVPEIVVVATEQELPLRILGQLVKGERTKTTPGLFDPKSGKVYLIASNLHNANDVALTIAHEVAGHFGLRDMLGGDYTRTMNALYAGNPAVRKQADAKMAEDSKLSQQVAVEEVLADMAETGGTTPAEKSALRRIYDALRNWFRTQLGLPNVTDAEVRQIVTNARKQVMEGGEKALGTAPEGEVLRRSNTAKYSEENALTTLADRIVASPKSWKERVGNNFGLEMEMWGADSRAGLRDVLQRGADAMGDDTLFTQAMYNVRKADQVMPMVQTILTNGPIEQYTDEKGLRGWRSINKHSGGDVFARVADIPLGNAQGKMNLATVYMIAQRATNKGLPKLDIGGLGVTQEQINEAMAAADADPELKTALEAVRSEYNAFNEGLIRGLASTGAVPKAVAAKLIKDGDYVPFYRVNENGMADLVFNAEVTINIGDIRRQPYLAELKGGETKIMPLDESLPRNTLLITQKMLTNTGTKSVAAALQAMGDGQMPIHKGMAPAGNDIIKFNQEPDANDPKDNGQRWLRVKTEGTAMEGIPAELVVKSLEGAHLTLPAFLKIGGIASDFLRAGVTRMPMYLVRQLIRDPMAASFTGGLNYNPLRAVAKAGKEFISMSRGTSEAGAKLLEKGLIQSGIFTGDPTDLSKMALQIASGKDQAPWDKLFAVMDRAAMRADAATRTQIYDNAIANGLSEVEADMMTMESMNFYKRGLSPTVQYAARLIPFFNAQIQGLNVLYKAARGKMPFEEQQQIKRKFFNNAMLLVGTGIVYAMAMDDDEYFKNAKPKDKYSNFFLPTPFTDEPFKLPIPYEAGWFFSLAVASVDAMKAETDGKQQWQALRDMFLSSVPGYSSLFVPQAVKPLFEVWSNKSFFSGNAIESARMERLSAPERFNAATTEAAKALSKALPVLSPVQIEHIATGYFGQLPLIVAGAANGLFRKEEAGEPAEKRVTEMPFIGSAFQKKFGGADADVAYREATKAINAKDTFDKMRKEGRVEEAKEFLEDNRVEVMSANMARNFQTQMGRLRNDADRIRSMPNMSAQEKRARLDKLEEASQAVADRYQAALKRIGQAT